MASSRTCRADSPNGEYRCLFVAAQQEASAGGQYVAQALDAYLVNPDGVQTKLGVTPIDATGATESAALSNACVEFAAWVSHRPRL